uniref:Uncharacterized protein n=1 Tax=Oryza punctata TaxID=4537 RepID=A0A0E0KIC9_ORYPU
MAAPETEGKVRQTRWLTLEQIDRAIAFEGRPFRSKLLDMLDIPGSGDLAKVAQHVDEMPDIRMRVLCRFILHGYVDVTDNEDDKGETAMMIKMTHRPRWPLP